jgi:hypothetical protein
VGSASCIGELAGLSGTDLVGIDDTEDGVPVADTDNDID